MFTHASRYNWACVLINTYSHNLDGKEQTILHPVMYVSGLFRSSQLYWAALTKETYAIYMSAKKLSFYVDDTDITVRSEHFPLKIF